jgi:hypothetical protein
LGAAKAHLLVLEDAMTNDVKLPRRLSEEAEAPKPRRPSHENVIDQIERWANSPGLQPPVLSNAKTL